MQDIQNRLIALIDSSGKDDAKIERELNLPRSTVYDWRKGRSKSYRNYLSQIATYFGVSTDYLLGNDQKEKPLVNGDKELTAYLDMLRTRPEMRMLFDITKDATKADVEKAVQIIEAYLKK